MSVNGFDEVEKTLQEVSELDTRQAVGEAIQFVRSAAVENCHADTGELRQSIFAETTEEENTVTGICWTDKAYAPYIEFGTGPKGQEKHAGISPEVTPVYTQQPWWIHESQIDRRVAEKYRWPYIDTPDGRFYRCSGNPAYPFLYPAMKDNEEQILKMLGGSLASDLEDIFQCYRRYQKQGNAERQGYHKRNENRPEQQLELFIRAVKQYTWKSSKCDSEFIQCWPECYTDFCKWIFKHPYPYATYWLGLGRWIYKNR